MLPTSQNDSAALSQPVLRLRAPAKINLGLEVLRRRSDGYHDLNTAFAALDLHDSITLARRDDGQIKLSVVGNPELGSDASNLCVRAALALRDHVGDRTLGLEIELEKRIPIGAGLGGGSSDAAGVLKGAAALWGVDVGNGELSELASALGSDVPFFLRAGLAIAGSRGETLNPVDLALPFAILLVNPGIHIATPWAYQQVARNSERPATDLELILRRGVLNPEILRAELVNDFEPAMFGHYPQLARIKERLYDAGAVFALMSGSGSTMFGLFGTAAEATAAALEFAPYWTCVTLPDVTGQ